MGAQRKLADPAPTAPLENAAPADYQSPRTAEGAIPNSPAILLQEQLAARIAGTEQVQGVAEVTKWPMPLRIATIVGLSLALWAGVVLTAAVIIT